MKRAFPTALTVAVALAGIVLLRSRFATAPIPEPGTPEANGTSTVEGLESQEITPDLETLPSPEIVDAAPGSRSAVEAEVFEPAPPAPGMTRIIARDEKGNPVEGAMVMLLRNREADAASERQGNTPITITNEFGILDVELGTVGGYYVWILSDDFVPIAEEEDQARAADPDGEPWLFELRRPAETRFVVLDDANSEPIETYGIFFGQRKVGSMIFQHEELHEPALHPGGEFVVPAEPGVDYFTVVAEGYHPAGGRVSHLAPDDPTQVVRLQLAPPSKDPPPPPALKGRLLEGGTPLAGIPWELRHGDLIPRRDSAEQSWSGFSSGYRGKQLLGFFEAPPNPSRTGQTDTEGRFVISEIELGHLRLDLLVSPDSLPLQRFMEVIRDSGEIDLGDLDLGLMASIDGHAVIPERIDATQVNVLLDRGEETSVIVCPLDASGNFRAHHLEPGTARIWVEPLYGQLRNTDLRAIELHSGSTATPTIDATDQEYCEIQLHVKTALEWLEYPPTLQLDADVPEYWYSHLGQDKNGFLSRDVAPFPELYLMVSYDLRRAVHPDPLELPPGGLVEATRTFEFGALHVELPTPLELPERGYANLSFESIRPELQKNMPGCRHELRTRIEDHRGSEDAATWSSELSSTADGPPHYKVGYLSAGTYTVKLEIFEIAPDQPRRGPIASTSIFESTTRAVVRINEESRARIR